MPAALPTKQELIDYCKSLPPEKLAELDALLLGGPVWLPNPGMQTAAYHCPADILLYAGSAGGGKSDLLLGLAATAHYNSAIWRRQYSQLDAIIERGNAVFVQGRPKKDQAIFRGAPPFIGWRFKDGRRIRLAAMQHEDDKKDWQGHAHDFKGFDEITQFTYSQFSYVIAWLRTPRPGQRTRIVCCGNPPQTAEGQWVLDAWAPWLREDHPRPAQPGEIRYVVRFDDKPDVEVEVESKEPVKYQGKFYYPQSKTFLPCALDDNPWYDGGQYRSALQSMPEPLRSQLLYGDFKAGLRDGAWQGIPTAWVRTSQAKWRAKKAEGMLQWMRSQRIDQVGVDVSRGGQDRTVITPRYNMILGEQVIHKGVDTNDGQKVATLVVQVAPDLQTRIVIDVVGVGTAPYDVLKVARPGKVTPFNSSEATSEREAKGMLTFHNCRAWAHWRMREALDPANGDNQLLIPDDPELLSDLCAWQWKLAPSGAIQVEEKEKIIKRLGRSPDKGESAIYASLPQGTVDFKQAFVAPTVVSTPMFNVALDRDAPWNL